MKLVIALLMVAVSILTLTTGGLAWESVWEGVLNRLDGTSARWNPLLDERLPRLIVLFCTGASLAVAGAVMQSIFHNPLASPSVLGITTGGALCAIFIFILGFSTIHPYLISIGAVAGCFITLITVYLLSLNQAGPQLNNLILTGIAISTFLLAIQGSLLYSLRDQWELIQTITEWESGSTVDRSWRHVHMQLPLTLIGLAGCWVYRAEMNLMALGEEEAKNLGIEVEKVRYRLFLCVALLTGGALAALGSIAFFGLILPHLVRGVVGSDHRRVIPLCLFGGAIVIAGLDIALRLLEIRSLSVGTISAMIGGIFFLLLLSRSQKVT
jgi:iron complex transport system permease protein